MRLQFARSLVCTLALVLATVCASAQHPRLILVEDFGSMTSQASAQIAPALNNLTQRSDVLRVSYHLNEPFPGDPYYAAYAPSSKDRAELYAARDIPEVFVNGSPVLSSIDTNSIIKSVQSAAGMKSDLLIEVTEDRTQTPWIVHIKIRNDGSKSYSGLSLHSMVVNRHVDLSNWSVVSSNVNKQYTVFDQAFLRDLPSINGSQITLAANEEIEIDRFYSTGSPQQIWTNPEVIVFVQDNTTREILQAGTSLVRGRVFETPLSELSNYGRIDNGAKNFEQSVRLNNPYDTALIVDLSIDFKKSIIPNGWSVSLENSTVELGAGLASEPRLLVNSDNTAGYAKVVVNAVPRVQGDNKAKLSSTTVHVLSSSISSLIISTWLDSASLADTYLPVLKTSVATRCVALPAEPSVINQFDLSSIPCIILPIRDANASVLGSDTANMLCRQLSAALENGQRLIIASTNAASTAFHGGSADARVLLQHFGISGIIGAKPVTHAVFNSTGDLLGYTPFGVRGQSEDELGGSIGTLQINTDQTRPAVSIRSTDPLEVDASGTGIAFLRYDTASYVAGVRSQTENSRAIFLSFTPESIQNVTQRRALLNSMMQWIMSPLTVKADIRVTGADDQSSAVEFGFMKAYETRVSGFHVHNTGQAVLHITDMYIDPDYSSLMRFVPQPTFPIDILPGESKEFVVRFRPVKEEFVATSCTVVSNAKTASNGESYFLLSATVSGIASDVADNTDATSSLQVSPQPANERLSIKLNNVTLVASSQELTGTIRSMLGIPVMQFNATTVDCATGLTMSVAQLPAGLYTLDLSATSQTLVARTCFIVSH